MDDWESVTKIGSKARGGGGGGGAFNDRTGEKKFAIGNAAKGNTEGQRQKKLDEATDIVKPKEIPSELPKAIKTAREAMEPKCSQKDLGQKTGILANDISRYEAGSALPSTKHFELLERVLKVQLRGKNIGEPKVFKSKKQKELEAAEAKKAAAAAKK